MKLAIVLTAATLMLVGCEDKPTDGPSAPTEAAADLPVPADFEEEAEKSVTTSNYKDQLATIEKEIDTQ